MRESILNVELNVSIIRERVCFVHVVQSSSSAESPSCHQAFAFDILDILCQIRVKNNS